MLLISISIAFTQTINEQIKSLEYVTPTERVALMNQIKEQLIEMNQNERMNTIEKLRAKMNPSKKEVPKDEHLQYKDEALKREEHKKDEPKKLEHDVKERQYDQAEPIKDRIEHSYEGFERPKDQHERVRGIERQALPQHRDIKDR
ncbi:MAG: Unknown protein [uncultured Sulfurovum sp.]|uniref:Uncharacterized protein n=1 Tax=uncultured Sulfurovum sp. TaxID=269237 RepID=A0A6S6U6Z5_9BACT|nr:MAG: Unknown protein [uncultured Sulfurovum sp.]